MSAFSDQFSETPTDPISAFFRFLWLRFETDPLLNDAVRVGNRITFSGDQKTIKENVSEGDLPEVMLTFPDFNINYLDSASDILLISGRWTVVTGTQKFYNSITYYLFLLSKLIKRIEKEGTPDLGLPTVILHRITTDDAIPFGYVDTELNRGKKGFASNLNFKAELSFSRSIYNV